MLKSLLYANSSADLRTTWTADEAERVYRQYREHWGTIMGKPTICCVAFEMFEEAVEDLIFTTINFRLASSEEEEITERYKKAKERYAVCKENLKNAYEHERIYFNAREVASKFTLTSK